MVTHFEYVDPRYKANFRLFWGDHCLTWQNIFHFRHWPPPPPTTARKVPRVGWGKRTSTRVTFHYENVCTQKGLFFINATSIVFHGTCCHCTPNLPCSLECQRGQKIRGNPSVMRAAARLACLTVKTHISTPNPGCRFDSCRTVFAAKVMDMQICRNPLGQDYTKAMCLH